MYIIIYLLEKLVRTKQPLLQLVDILTSFSFATQLIPNVIIDNKRKTPNHLIIKKNPQKYLQL